MVKRSNLLIFILTIGVFGIINTEMGVIGILPSIAEHFHVSVPKAGWLVSFFTLAVAVSGPTMPLLFSGIDRKKIMLLVLGVFVLGNIVSIFTPNFTIALVAHRRESRDRAKQAAESILWLATIGREGPSGGFFRDGKQIPS